MSPLHNVVAIIRNPAQQGVISVIPLVLSLEESSISDFADVFEGIDVVYFSAGAGPNGGGKRTKAVDYEGAIKIFEALEAVRGPKYWCRQLTSGIPGRFLGIM